jgi:hypothetical protein
MTSIEIRVVNNGFIAREALSPENPLERGPMNVFNSWSDLVHWINSNLDEPLEGVRKHEESFAEQLKIEKFLEHSRRMGTLK